MERMLANLSRNSTIRQDTILIMKTSIKSLWILIERRICAILSSLKISVRTQSNGAWLMILTRLNRSSKSTAKIHLRALKLGRKSLKSRKTFWIDTAMPVPSMTVIASSLERRDTWICQGEITWPRNSIRDMSKTRMTFNSLVKIWKQMTRPN